MANVIAPEGERRFGPIMLKLIGRADVGGDGVIIDLLNGIPQEDSISDFVL